MTTGTSVSSSTSTSGITWKTVVGGTRDAIRIKLTYNGKSREINAAPGPISDGSLENLVINVIRQEAANNQSLNTVREGVITLTASSVTERLTSDTDWPGF